MSPSRALLVLAVCLGAILPAAAALPSPDDLPAGPPQRGVLAVAEVTGPVAEVAPWDPASPQRLVRIEGRLYQEDAGWYFPVVADRVTVRLAEGVSDWDELLARALAASPQGLAGLAQLRPVRSNRLSIVDLALPAGTDVTAWAELLFRTGLVRYAEVATRGVWAASPNDPRYNEQWALKNTGQSGGTPGADIDAEAAWDLSTGDPSVVVGVLDSGTDVDHEDLSAGVWHNPGEVPNNGVDDDGNGFVDDWEGWDFGNGNNDPRSTYFHGTHVTGIVNATTGNAIGIAGIAGGLGGGGVRAMAVAVGETGPLTEILDDAILYAADNGAQVITLSLSVGETQAINDALAYAYTTRDVFIDCAAGNSGSSVSYPARRPEAMAVASTNRFDQKSGFSNPGPELEVAAPGEDILSTQLGSTYGNSSGTSFAAPQVAGTAALIRSRNPGLSASQVRQTLIDSAEDVEDPGFDTKTGHGRINANEALLLSASSDGQVRLQRDAYSCSDLAFVTVSDIDLAGTASVNVTIRSGQEPGGESLSLAEENPGSGVFRGSIATAAGAPAPDGMLQVAHADAITAEYLDADDGEGGIDRLKTDTAGADCLEPMISGIGATEISTNSARIGWMTDEPATSSIRYGQTTPPGQEKSVPGLATTHSVPLSGLTECTIYKYEVRSADALSNHAIDDNAGTYYTFETYGNFPGVGVIPCHQGQARLDREVYACSDVASVTVTDIDLNQDPLVQESIAVLVTSTSEPDGELLTVTELDADNSRFAGPIQLGTSLPVTGDGLLTVRAGDLVTVTYEDHDDGEGNRRTTTDTSRTDCIAPAIGSIRVTELSSTRAVVEWTTDEPATSRVEFGPTATLGRAVEDLALETTHRLALSAYTACDRLHFRIRSVDAHGDERVADADGVPFGFNFRRIGGLLFHDNFEADSGWQLPGEWERGAPQARGSGAGDPEAAFSGISVIGQDLAGQGSFPGDYEPNSNDTALSPIMNASGRQHLELILRRTLGVTAIDRAKVLVYSSGAQPVWTSTEAVNDTEWREARYDISGIADNQPALRVGFRLEADGAGQSFGWNVDELIVKDATQPDYLACGGCSGAPAFGGATGVVDPDACAAGGLSVSWEPAAAAGTGSTVTYEVYRSTDPAFVPGPTNRVASGLGGSPWTDAGAPVGIAAHYVVRARNDESCTGGSGLDDGNTQRVAGIETLVRPPAASPGGSLRVRRVGAAHVRLSWVPTADTASYVVRRSEARSFSNPVELGRPADPLWEDADALTNSKSYFYRVAAANACGEETP